MDAEPRMYDENETASRLGVSKHTLRNWRQAGTGPPWYKLGHAVRYDKDDIAKYLKAGRREGDTHERP